MEYEDISITGLKVLSLVQFIQEITLCIKTYFNNKCFVILAVDF